MDDGNENGDLELSPLQRQVLVLMLIPILVLVLIGIVVSLFFFSIGRLADDVDYLEENVIRCAIGRDLVVDSRAGQLVESERTDRSRELVESTDFAGFEILASSDEMLLAAEQLDDRAWRRAANKFLVACRGF